MDIFGGNVVFMIILSASNLTFFVSKHTSATMWRNGKRTLKMRNLLKESQKK